MDEWYVLKIGSYALSYASSRTILIVSAKELLTDYLKKKVRELDLILSPEHDSVMNVVLYDEPVLSITQEEMPETKLKLLQEAGKLILNK